MLHVLFLLNLSINIAEPAALENSQEYFKAFFSGVSGGGLL